MKAPKQVVHQSICNIVMFQRADLAITDLTINRDREKAVDFTTPFMNLGNLKHIFISGDTQLVYMHALGIMILYRKPTKSPPSFFSFAAPFSVNVWILLIVSYFGVSMSIFIMARICQSEWINPYPCIEVPEFLVNQLNLRNSFWFNLGGLMQQGSDIAPA